MSLNNIPRDTLGYLKNFDDWNESVAHELAEESNITLTEEHWLLLHYIQSFYREYHMMPALRLWVKMIKNHLPEENANSTYLTTLFTEKPAMIAAKIAGLPKPVRCM
jgi:tRNA 2-thiouridine synthesizing protein E